jgi:predicted nucleotidyltransferase
MSSIVEKLTKRGLIDPPNFVKSNTMYECVVGSVAYGTSDDLSDFDVNGFCIPPRDVVFPHLKGEIEGFGRNKKKFGGWQQHHIKDEDALNGLGREYDLNIYNIVKYMQLCMENNPNMVTTLFVPRDCVLWSTAISEMVREKRNIFLHKGAWHKYKGYAYAQRHKMQGKNPEPGSKRDLLRQKYGYDVKFAMHTVRLLYEAEQILNELTIDIRRHKEHLKAIRHGEVPMDDVLSWCDSKEIALERAYESSSLRHGPDIKGVKTLLLDCLEHHYGSLSKVVARPDELADILEQIALQTDRYKQIQNRKGSVQ